MSETNEIEVDLGATPEVVWNALTDAHQLQQWFAPPRPHQRVDGR